MNTPTRPAPPAAPAKSSAKPSVAAKRNGKFRLGRRRNTEGIITLSAAGALLEEMTGRRVTLKGLAGIMYQRPHLALFDINPSNGRARFLGVRQKRWQYFLQARLASCGRRGIFHLDEL